MKHIKKKFKFEKVLSELENEKIAKVGIQLDIKKPAKEKPPKDYHMLIQTTHDISIQAFYVSINGKNYYIPEPDPMLIYFDNAYTAFRDIEKSRPILLDKLEIHDNGNIGEWINEIYRHFGFCNSFVIFLFTSIEAFINNCILENYEYKVVKNNRTEIYNKEQIEKHISFDEKIKNVLIDVTKKDFISKYKMKYQHIVNLKEFRDGLIHIKAEKSGMTPYDYLFKKGLNFKYEDTIHAVRDFINFYKPGYIEECNCGEDY